MDWNELMILDGHIHIQAGDIDRECFLSAMDAGGFMGGILMSREPPSFYGGRGACLTPSERLDNLFSWAGDNPNIFPFYWIDPMEEDALHQVELAVQRGVRGFKVICDRFFPGDERPMEVFRSVSNTGRPILFHSGILWDGQPSSKYNQPVAFEALLLIDGLRFSLAHIAWPWCDELIAVYGKFLNARAIRPDYRGEMFIDVTPGTPVVYRREVLTRLFNAGYDVRRNVIFGSDNYANTYDSTWAQEWVSRDMEIYGEIGIENSVIDAVFADNLRRFVGAP